MSGPGDPAAPFTMERIMFYRYLKEVNVNPVAFFRRVVVGHTMMMLVVVFLLPLFFEPRYDAQPLPWWFWVLAFGPATLLATYVTRVLWITRHFRKSRDVSILRDLFVFGVSLKYFQKMYESEKEMRVVVDEYVLTFGDVNGEKEINELLNAGQFEQAVARFTEILYNAERAERISAYDARARERHSEREHRRRMRESTEYTRIYEEGVRLGVPEDKLRNDLSFSLAAGRYTIGLARRKHQILLQARNAGCEKHVERLIGLDGLDTAEAYVAHARRSLARAENYEQSTREQIKKFVALGLLGDAETLLRREEDRAAREREKAALLSRIRDRHTKAALRIELEPLALALDPGKCNSDREWRMSLHDIEIMLK